MCFLKRCFPIFSNSMIFMKSLGRAQSQVLTKEMHIQKCTCSIGFGYIFGIIACRGCAVKTYYSLWLDCKVNNITVFIARLSYYKVTYSVNYKLYCGSTVSQSSVMYKNDKANVEIHLKTLTRNAELFQVHCNKRD